MMGPGPGLLVLFLAACLPLGLTQPQCSAGQFGAALSGTCTSCPAGRFGSVPGLTNPACSGPCWYVDTDPALSGCVWLYGCVVRVYCGGVGTGGEAFAG